jgi:hypothetical protein
MNPVGSTRRIGAFLAIFVAAATFATGARARPGTTAPTKLVTVLVLIDEKGIKLSMFTARDNQNTLDTMSSRIIPRGDYVTINVLNRGHRHHDFTFMGKRTPAAQAGRQGAPVRRRERPRPVPVSKHPRPRQALPRQRHRPVRRGARPAGR